MGQVSPPEDKEASLREAIREGNQLLKDLKAERKAIKDLIETIRPDTEKKIEDTVSIALDAMVTEMNKGIESSVNRILTRFEKLEGLLMGGGRSGKQPLEEVAEAFVARRKEMLSEHPRPPVGPSLL